MTEPDYQHYANRLMFESIDGDPAFVEDISDEEEVREAAEEYAELLLLDEEKLRAKMLQISDNAVAVVV